MRKRIQAYTAYKAGLNGVPVVTVDPLHTSQRCPRCSHTEKKNRKGILFSCLNCGYKNNADRVSSINIAQRYLGVFVEHKPSTDNMQRDLLLGNETSEKRDSLEAYEFIHR